MTITIEDALTKHLDRLCELEIECFDTEAFTRQQIVHLLADYNSVSLIAREEGNIVGFVSGVIQAEENSLIGHIVTIDVLRSHRRMGLGIKLLQEIERIFKEKDVKTCCLEAREDNKVALNLYQKLGYRKVGRLKNYYGKAHGMFLRKSLTQP